MTDHTLVPAQPPGGDGIALAIDGRSVRVPEGTTILKAAESLGIRIPTLCHEDGQEPFASCFVCVVQVEGNSSLVPSCAMPVEDGMVVRTSTDEVIDARRTALELLLSEHRGDCVAPCEMACPAGLDIASMCGRLKAGRVDEAIVSMRERIPFNAILGRICPRYCERVCRRRLLDEAVGVADLQRFAGDAALKTDSHPRKNASLSGKRVAIVGAGLAGLSAAYFLLEKGHACTLFDANSEPGGMLRYGIGRFRLPGAVLDGEIELVRRLGATFRPNTRLGKDLSLESLRRDFDAVLLALGAQIPGALTCEGADLAQPALELMKQVNIGESVEARTTLLVVGAGQAGIEAARTARRLGWTQVTILCEGDAPTQPGMKEALAEGVAVESGVRVLRLEQTDAGRLRVTTERDGGVTVVEADEVLCAVKRAVDRPFLEQFLPMSERGIRADRLSGATELEGVFAAGECVSGASHAVHAVAQGRRAAVVIGHYLKGEVVGGEVRRVNVRMGKLTDEEIALVRQEAHPASRVRTRTLVTEPRSSFNEVRAPLTPEQAARESRRCLQCSCSARTDCKLRELADEYKARPERFGGARRIFRRDVSHPNVVYEPGKCILCGRCVRLSRQTGEPLGLAFLARGFETSVGVPFGGLLADALKTSAGQAVGACPTGALTFENPRNIS